MRADLRYVSVNAEVFGDGDIPVLFLHGNGESSKIFSNIAKYLPERYKAFCPDTRGHGKSTYAPLSYDYFADDLKEFIEKTGLRAPVVVGFSDGGITALKVMVKYPGTISRAVLCGANFAPDGLKKSAVRLFKMQYFLFRSERIRLMLEEPVFEEKDLEKIDVPVLILAGERDLVRREHTERLHSLIKGSELKIIPGEGHSGYVRDNGKLFSEIKDFIGRQADMG